jgi:plasmid maintenance system antidote protein VapI
VALRPTIGCGWAAISKHPRSRLNLQTKYDLEVAEDENLAKIERDVPPIEMTVR